MSSRDTTLIVIDPPTSLASAAASRSTLLSAFGRMMQLIVVTSTIAIRDRCQRPVPIYNHNYNPYKPLKDT